MAGMMPSSRDRRVKAWREGGPEERGEAVSGQNAQGVFLSGGDSGCSKCTRRYPTSTFFHTQKMPINALSLAESNCPGLSSGQGRYQTDTASCCGCSWSGCSITSWSVVVASPAVAVAGVWL